MRTSRVTRAVADLGVSLGSEAGRMVMTVELLRPFAASIHAKVVAVRSLSLTARQRARFLESISDDIKKCTNFVAPRASLAAMKAAARLKVDLSAKGWHEQTAFDPGRRIFHLEHLVPPQAAIWTEDKLPWVQLDPTRRAFPRSRDENA